MALGQWVSVIPGSALCRCPCVYGVPCGTWEVALRAQTSGQHFLLF